MKIIVVAGSRRDAVYIGTGLDGAIYAVGGDQAQGRMWRGGRRAQERFGIYKIEVLKIRNAKKINN